MSQLSRFIDRNVTHSSERREARERADKQMAEFDKQRSDLKAEHDRIDAQKKSEKDRRDKKNVRRLKGGMRRGGFLSGPETESKELLG